MLRVWLIFMNKDIIAVVGVFDGVFTGQIKTTKMVLSILKDRFGDSRVRVIRQPVHVSIIDIFRYFFGIISFGWVATRCCYLSISRTRSSFFVRDLPILICAKLFSVQLKIHIVGNEFCDFLDRSVIARYVYAWLASDGETKFIVLSHRMHDELSMYFSQKLYSVIAPGFLEPHIESARVSKPILEERLFIGFMANLIPSKGVFEFLDAISALRMIEGIEIDAWIAGEKIAGVDYSKLDQMVQCGIVNYTPFVDGAAKERLLVKTHIFCLPSYYPTEALPLALVEAGAYGCFLIGCENGDISNVIDQKTGLLVKNRSPLAIVNAVREYIEKKKFCPSESSAHLIKKFGYRSYADTITAAFK